MRRGPSGMRTQTVELCQAAGFEPQVAFEADDLPTVRGLVAAGLGVAVVPAMGLPAPTTFALPSCPADVKNHGAYVSGVARSAPKGKDGEHGMWVSQAAHSDCGKSADSSAKPEPTETDSPDTERPETHSPKPDHSQPEKTDSPDATTTVGGDASVSTDTGGKHNTGHGDH